MAALTWRIPQMRLKSSPLTVAALVALAALSVTIHATPSYAVVINLTPTDIHGDDTNTASFTDGEITLTPFIGATQDTFNGNAVRLGLDDAGTNNNAFNDPDTDPNNGNEERLEFAFSATAALANIVYDFSRADGPGDDDGVIISGFNADPQISFSVDNANLFSVYNAGTGTARLNIPGTLFNGTDVSINFTNLEASRGETLLMSVTDTTQAGAQLAITGIGYDTATLIAGDVDGLNGVTIADFNIIRDNFFNTGATRSDGDLTGDGLVGIEDFDEWKTEFPGDGAAFASQLFGGVPEPSSALLIALGSLLTALRSRTRQ